MTLSLTEYFESQQDVFVYWSVTQLMILSVKLNFGCIGPCEECCLLKKRY